MKYKAVRQRDTKQRRMIYDAVMKRCDHPSADDIYTDVHSQDPRISKATVYRNLNLLSGNGALNHVRIPGADRFDSTLTDHYHIICTVCGKVTDAPVGYIRENDSIVEEKTGYVIKRHRTVFEGICPECMKNRNLSDGDEGRAAK